MLSQGLFTADVLYYYGDDVPNFFFLKEDVKDLGFGHDWDKCSKDALVKTLEVKDGKPTFPDGMNYRFLVLPNETAIDLEVLRKVELLVKQGLTIIAPRPLKATGLTNYPQSDNETKLIASRMWGAIDKTTITENNYGKGKVIWGKDVNTVLEEMKVKPDVAFTSTQPLTALDYIHRHTDDMDIYFVVNRFGRKEINDFAYHDIETLPDRYEQVECAFRITGMVPEIWDPLTGKTILVLVYKEVDGQTIIPLSFAPDGSQFIVYKKAAITPHIIQIEKDAKKFFPGNEYDGQEKPFLSIENKAGKIATTIFEPGTYTMTWSNGKVTKQTLKTSNSSQKISGSWQINFDPKWGGPSSVETDILKSWTLFDDDGIKYYSGTAHYKKTFSVNPKNITGNKVWLDLGNVSEMASVTINGHKLAVKWSAPFAFDITDYVKPFANQLDVEVVNLWPNRLIGDGKMPKEKRLIQTNIMKFDGKDSETFLRQSGLLGPVQLSFISHKNF